ncbi:MAG: methylenetetrahydrofolate reductase [Gammaproteobacteria bacterium]|nr:methylenetetrahydrofolate reductase [Gammaproteobacteria bacterium]MDH4256277.1 methylenetetrahydrofolate reductase [Gammaproteobacteria bacterium]MDH5311657.1 methylenetetrahydrofolate reductase [Gammaproteobacteria bacterium]
MSAFTDSIRSRDFVLTSEIFLQARSGLPEVRAQVELFGDRVDAILVTDNQSGRIHMSSLASALMVRACGMDAIMQISCRNRNRIAIIGDLLGAGAHGITSLQLVRGERVPEGFEPRPPAVLDVTATELIATASRMKTEEDLGAYADFFLGGVITPHAPKPGWVPRKLVEKVDAGAQFLLTHTCLDMSLVSAYMKHLASLHVLRRVNIIATVAVLTSVEDARWLRDNRPNVMIPKDVVNRLDRAADARAEGIAICSEQLRALAGIPGLSGAHVYAATDLSAVPAAIGASGIRPR